MSMDERFLDSAIPDTFDRDRKAKADERELLLKMARLVADIAIWGQGGKRNEGAELLTIVERIEAARGVQAPAAPSIKELLDRFERAAMRMGELWERCQGKGWPDAESDEFTKLRDERCPALRAEIEAAAGVAVPDPQTNRRQDADDVGGERHEP